MTIVGATYQKILIRLMLRSCKLCDVAHDFRADLRMKYRRWKVAVHPHTHTHAVAEA
jgi:hypothetical protein